MLIEEIELVHVAMPLKEPWRTAFSEETAIDTVLVRIRSGSEDGWGETAPYRLPQFSPEWASGAFALLRDAMAPALIGKSIDSGEALQRILAPLKGNQFAKAGLDNAWWDLAAKIAGKPLWQMIGGQGPRALVGADISVMEDLDDLVAAVGKAQADGFQRTKLKFRRGWGLEMVARVRQAFPDAVLHVDCNSAFSLDDIAMFRELDRFDLAMIEQPLAYDDLIDHARLQSELKTPICLDESITSLDRARKAIDIDAGRWINIKAGRVGGTDQCHCDPRSLRGARRPVLDRRHARIGGRTRSVAGPVDACQREVPLRCLPYIAPVRNRPFRAGNRPERAVIHYRIRWAWTRIQTQC